MRGVSGTLTSLERAPRTCWSSEAGHCVGKGDWGAQPGGGSWAGCRGRDDLKIWRQSGKRVSQIRCLNTSVSALLLYFLKIFFLHINCCQREDPSFTGEGCLAARTDRVSPLWSHALCAHQPTTTSVCRHVTRARTLSFPQFQHDPAMGFRV